MFISVLFCAFVVFTAIQIIYYLFFIPFLFNQNKQQKKNKELPISVIICAKNEAKNLQNFLPFMLRQNYSEYEVVLINDASTDTTLQIMKAFKEKHSNIKIIDVKNNET
jgi:cellulose synthase/poly-beta-1,6-N-acetylglucosamine synthase-like glycosyltransferase